MPEHQIPTVPDPPPIRKRGVTRVYWDCNITPIYKKFQAYVGPTEPDKNDHYAWYQMHEVEAYMQKLGFDATMMIYNGTIDLAATWSENGVPRDLVASGNRFLTARSKGSNCSDYKVAADRAYEEKKFAEAISALCKLSKNPGQYGSLAKPGLPIVFDIEATQTFNRHPANIKELLETTLAWQKLFAMARNLIGDYQAMYAYGYWQWSIAKYWEGSSEIEALPEWNEFKKAEQVNSRLLSGYHGYFYNWDNSLANPSTWYSEVLRAETLLHRYYPHWIAHKLATVTPVYQILAADPSKKNNTLIPLSTWESQIEFLVGLGFQIFVWGGNQVPFQDVKPYIEHVARYNK